MRSGPNEDSNLRIADVLGSVRRKGVRLWAENGQLRYKAPKGALTGEEIARLRISKDYIVALLETAGAQGAAASFESPRFYRAPLSFSQLAHWHLYQLSERPAIRQVAVALRLQGRLNVDALRRSLAEVIRRQDALRTRIEVSDDGPAQVIADSGNCELEVHDLMSSPENTGENEVQQLIEQLILQPIDVTKDALVGVRLLKLRDDEHVLAVAIEHLVSDAFSRGLLLRDLFRAYAQAARGRAFQLPAIPVQFAEYASWQRSAHRAWVETHGAHWDEHLKECRRLRFPDDPVPGTADSPGWGKVPVVIGKDVKAALREWCRLKRTTLVTSVFTAYVGFVLRWCNASDAVFQYQSDGRVSAEVENTIGYFASVLYLRVQLFQDDTFGDLTERVAEEYCRAYAHVSFSDVAARSPRPEFTRNTHFNWVPQAFKADLADLAGSNDAITLSPVIFEHPMYKRLDMDMEPAILLFDAEDKISGGVYFPLNRFSVETMEKFVRSFIAFIRALARNPERRLREIPLD